MIPTITAFERSPDRGRGLARDTRVRWALEEVGQLYDVRLVSFSEMKEPAHLALQPFGQIPTYEEGDLALFESGAIVLHVAQRHAGLLPSDPNARARAITWMFAALNTVEPPILDRSTAWILEGDKPWYEARRPLVENRIRDRLDQLSRRLGNADWLDGAFSAGDLMMVSVLRRLNGSGLLEEHPNLFAYVARGGRSPPTGVLSTPNWRCSPATHHPAEAAPTPSFARKRERGTEQGACRLNLSFQAATPGHEGDDDASNPIACRRRHGAARPRGLQPGHQRHSSAVTNAEVNATPSANPASTDLSTIDVTKAANFVTLVAASDMFEIQSSKIALQRSTNPDVKRFAQMMIDAHTKTTAALTRLVAGQSNLSLPTALPSDLQSKLDQLGSVSPADFDSAYLNDQVDGHQSALNVFQRYAKDGDLEPLKQFAASTAPVIQQHLDKAKKLLAALTHPASNAATNS